MRLKVCRGGALAALLGLLTFLAMAEPIGAQDVLVAGGAGDAGGNGGEIRLSSNRGILAGGRAKAATPKAPRVPSTGTLVAQDLDISGTVEVADLDASAGDLDPDLFEVTTTGNFVIPLGVTLAVEGDVRIISTRGSIFVGGDISDADGSDNGADVDLISLRRTVAVLGTIDLSGGDAVNGGDGGNLEINGLLVSVGGSAAIDLSGGSSTAGANGGNGGDLTVSSFDSVVQEKRISIGFGPGTTVDLRGGEGNNGGDGGTFDVDYQDTLGNRASLVLAGTIDVRGGNAENGGNVAGNGGTVRGDVGGNIALAGLLDASGGAGGPGADGGDGGEVRFGARAPTAGVISIVGDAALPNAPVVADLSGGDAATGSGGSGGSFEAETDQGPITWHGDILASGGAAADGDGAEGGEITLVTFGFRRADITVVGNLATNGSDGAVDGGGAPGGDVVIVSLDAGIRFAGDIDASAGSAAGLGNDADGDGGSVFIISDDLNGDPSLLPGLDGIDLLDNIGKSVFFQGTISTDGGNGGGGNDNGSNAGIIVIDADCDDGEESTNGTGLVAGGSTLSASGGNGSGTGENGDGGDITLRGSNRQEDNAAPSGFVLEQGATVTSSAGTGGAVAGADGVQNID
jgi:hypothetical protein